jgi:membrane protein DedA with SNARE-associated domain
MSNTLNNFLLHYSYVAIFVLSFISSMGIPAGSEVAIIGGGALASGEVHKLLGNGQPSSEYFHLSLLLVILLALAGELLGSMVGYLIGLKGGRVAVDRWGKYLLVTHKDLDRAEAWFDRHGDPLVLFGRFIPLLHLRQRAEEVQLRHVRRGRARGGGRSAPDLAPPPHHARRAELNRLH